MCFDWEYALLKSCIFYYSIIFWGNLTSGDQHNMKSNSIKAIIIIARLDLLGDYNSNSGFIREKQCLGFRLQLFFSLF